MIDYILISDDLKKFSENYVVTIFFSIIFLCIFFGFSIGTDFFKNEKKWRNKLSWVLTSFIILFVVGFNLSMISYNLSKAKRLEKKYSVKAGTLEQNIEIIENEIEFFIVKDKDLYVNQILNKFYKNERNISLNDTCYILWDTIHRNSSICWYERSTEKSRNNKYQKFKKKS